MRSNDSTDLAWAAGFFEGDGSIGIRPGGLSFACSVTATDMDTINFFQERWPGYVKRVSGGIFWQPAKAWTVQAIKAVAFLRDILPYVQADRTRTRIDLALEFQAQKRHRSQQDAGYAARQLEYHAAMKQLNLRGAQGKPLGEWSSTQTFHTRSLAELAWAAGCFEAEGNVRIDSTTKRNNGALICAVVNADSQIPLFFQERWPASCRVFPGVRAEHRSTLHWIAASQQAAGFLREILPFLRGEKRLKAELGIEYQAQKENSRYNRTAEYKAIQEEYFQAMKKLNKKGRS